MSPSRSRPSGEADTPRSARSSGSPPATPSPLAAGLVTGGRLGDIHGRRRILLLGIGGFTLAASALCGLAANPEMLVAARIARGATAALMVPQALSIVHATFPAHERGQGVRAVRRDRGPRLGLGHAARRPADAILSGVPREHAGSASGLISTVQQMGNALHRGLGLVAVVFFGTMEDHLLPAEIGPAFVDAFEYALGWVAAVLVATLLLMFALPARASEVEHGADDGAAEAVEGAEGAEPEPQLVR